MTSGLTRELTSEMKGELTDGIADPSLEGLPDELLFLEPTKKRESDSMLRLIIVETLVLLTSTRFGRDYMRQKQVYSVVRKLHLDEKDDRVAEVIERIVNMLMRDEEDIKDCKPCTALEE